MRKFSKYSETFGVIFGAALLVSGANSLIADHTAAPSIATYSLTHDLATRLIGVPMEISAHSAERDVVASEMNALLTLPSHEDGAKAGS